MCTESCKWENRGAPPAPHPILRTFCQDLLQQPGFSLPSSIPRLLPLAFLIQRRKPRLQGGGGGSARAKNFFEVTQPVCWALCTLVDFASLACI